MTFALTRAFSSEMLQNRFDTCLLLQMIDPPNYVCVTVGIVINSEWLRLFPMECLWKKSGITKGAEGEAG